MALFAQYAMASTEEALEDAAWKPTAFEDREATVGFRGMRWQLMLTCRESVSALGLATSTRSIILLSIMIGGLVECILIYSSSN